MSNEHPDHSNHIDSVRRRLMDALGPTPEQIATMPTDARLGFMVNRAQSREFESHTQIVEFMADKYFACFTPFELRLTEFICTQLMIRAGNFGTMITLDEFAIRAHSLVDMAVVNMRKEYADVDHPTDCTCHLQTEYSWFVGVANDLISTALTDLDHEWPNEKAALDEMRERLSKGYDK